MQALTQLHAAYMLHAAYCIQAVRMQITVFCMKVVRGCVVRMSLLPNAT